MICTPDSQQKTWKGKCWAYRLIDTASRGGASSIGEVDFDPRNRLPSISRVRHLLRPGILSLLVLYVGILNYPPIIVDKESIVLLPIHGAGHSSLIEMADSECFKNIVGASKSFEPDDLGKLHLPSVI